MIRVSLEASQKLFWKCQSFSDSPLGSEFFEPNLANGLLISNISFKKASTEQELMPVNQNHMVTGINLLICT